MSDGDEVCDGMTDASHAISMLKRQRRMAPANTRACILIATATPSWMKTKMAFVTCLTVCRDIGRLAAMDGAVYDCGCVDIPWGACDCEGNVEDECGVCGGDGIAADECDCDGSQLDALGVCGGPCASDADRRPV